ncbi:Uncharacterised protein [uncultured archaeon]|nr:Uncharacterised protein [uncultured archaeon]
MKKKEKINKNKKIDAWQIVAYIAIIVIIISIVNFGMRLTGHATSTDTAVVNVTVSATAAINFTTDFINFGSGGVSDGSSSAMLESNGTAAVGGSWNWGSAQNFTLENIGNVNVSLDLKTSKTAATFIGGFLPQYNFTVRDTETGSCLQPGTTLGVWQSVNTTGDGTKICGNFTPEGAHDKITIDVRLVIPSDSFSGNEALTDTFTAKGTSA